MAIPAMAGHGAYNQHATAQATAGGFGIALLASAARRTPCGPSGVVTIADYGASQGRNSLDPLSAAIDAIRSERGAGQEIVVVHTDLPDNDFATLFRTVAADNPSSYWRPGVFPAAVGRSFYEQLLPTATVGLGWELHRGPLARRNAGCVTWDLVRDRDTGAVPGVVGGGRRRLAQVLAGPRR